MHIQDPGQSQAGILTRERRVIQSAFTLKSNSLIIVIDMKQLLLIAALSLCFWPADAFAGGPPSPADHPGETAADAPGTGAKAFIHPETGEVLTHEQWQSLGTEDGRGAAAARAAQDAPEPQSGGAVLEGRKVDLGNGDYAIIVDAPDSERTETRVRFDENGKAHLSCGH